VGTCEVAAGRYTAFLNAVAADDACGLCNPNKWSSDRGCKIERAGAPGSRAYSVAAGWANRPANHVSWGDAAGRQVLAAPRAVGIVRPTRTVSCAGLFVESRVAGDDEQPPSGVAARNTTCRVARRFA